MIIFLVKNSGKRHFQMAIILNGNKSNILTIRPPSGIVAPVSLELTTLPLKAECSDQLSYEAMNKISCADGNRTHILQLMRLACFHLQHRAILWQHGNRTLPFDFSDQRAHLVRYAAKIIGTINLDINFRLG